MGSSAMADVMRLVSRWPLAFLFLEMFSKCGCSFSEPDYKAPLARLIYCKTRKSSRFDWLM